jgi:transposase
MIFIGDDWAEEHHDIYLMDEAGRRLASRRLPEGLTGISALHELIAQHAEEPQQVVIGIETDRGLWVGALTAAGYQVYAINPMAVAHYRDRHHVSGAKSDSSDAKLLAELVRTDRHNHRPIAGDSTTWAFRNVSRGWRAGLSHASLHFLRRRHTRTSLTCMSQPGRLTWQAVTRAHVSRRCFSPGS